MNESTHNALVVASVFAGLSGWAAIFAWWFRERSKTVRGIKVLRRTNARLQKTVMFTLDKWRDQVERNQVFLLIEREYADRLAFHEGVAADQVKEHVRNHVQSVTAGDARESGHERRCEPEVRHQLAAIREVEEYARSGRGKATELEIEKEIRRAA